MAERYEFSAFCFEVGPDPQNPKQQRVLVFKDGLPFTDLHGAQVTKKFAAKAGSS